MDESGKQLLNTIYNITVQMSHLVEELLAFARFRHQEVNASEIDMEGLAKNASREIKTLHPGRRLQLGIKALPPACGDEAMIRQVLVNLLANAIKFTHPENAVVIEIGAKVEGGMNIYYVKENGIGFDMEQAEKIFEIFERLHPAKEYEGSGLGLAIVRRIIERCGGRVWAEGQVDRGATFYFSLPKAGSINHI
ncbi:MAG: hypothetical protein HY730_08005 [Candidatus Tectomicrobia bacterium]|uniref:histidine kinase n=1 Tax=Tectimicrobiota bacterium TaxID=2528274 RepID=A0A933GLW3_UNCTE|nr:hypothetical protein [Candidatus Tectomicrobia bacterium]